MRKVRTARLRRRIAARALPMPIERKAVNCRDWRESGMGVGRWVMRVGFLVTSVVRTRRIVCASVTASHSPLVMVGIASAEADPTKTGLGAQRARLDWSLAIVSAAMA